MGLASKLLHTFTPKKSTLLSVLPCAVLFLILGIVQKSVKSDAVLEAGYKPLPGTLS